MTRAIQLSLWPWDATAEDDDPINFSGAASESEGEISLNYPIESRYFS
jgi:hypothetical protein